MFTVFWAAMRTGLHVVPVNRHLLAAGDPLHPRRRRGRRRRRLPGRRPGLARRHRRSPRPPPRADGGGDRFGPAALARRRVAGPVDDAEEGQLLLYSSGTTGRPRGILRPLPGFGPGQGPTTGSEIAAGFGLVEGDRYLSTGPLYHSAPFAFSTGQQRIGATAVVMTRFDAAAALRILVEEDVTTSQWVPTMFSRLLALPEDVRKAFHAPSHRLAVHAAAPCPVGVKRQMIDWWGPILVEYYSASEGGRTMITSPEWLERPGSVGRHWRRRPGLDPRRRGRALPARRRRPGLLRCPAPGEPLPLPGRPREDQGAPTTPPAPGSASATSAGSTTTATSSSPTATATSSSAAGVNIYPREAENVLLEHPAVADVAVVGLSDADLGQRAVAIVVPAAGVEPDPALAEELLAHCRGHLARFKCPRELRFSDRICPGPRPASS